MVNLFLSFFFFLLLPPSFKRSTIRLFLAKHVYVYVYMHVCALGTRTTSPPHNMEMAVELCRAVVVAHAPTPGPSNSTTSNIPDPLVLSSFPPRHLHSLPSHLFIRLHYYIIRANHNICIYNVQTTEFFFFFFFTLLILTRTRTPPLETDCASYRSPGGEIRVHVSNHACDFEELENGKPFFLLLSFHRKIPLPSQYIYIYL